MVPEPPRRPDRRLYLRYTRGLIASEKHDLQETAEQSDQKPPEQRLLQAIIGSSGHGYGLTIPEDFLSRSTFDAVLGVPAGMGAEAVTALAQKWITRHLPAVEIGEISTLASAVIGDKDKATQWLSEPNVATDNRAPIDLIGETDGFERVKNLLLRIEYGVLA